MPINRFQGKVVIITGGDSGIGLVTARLFLEEGARVVLAARNEQRGKEALHILDPTGDRAIFIPCDVCRSGDCERVVQQTINTFGHIDVLFNNAGVIYINRSVTDTPEDLWDETIDVNLKGTYLMSKTVIPYMIHAGGGVIVNNASVFGLVGGMGAAAYCAAKGGVVLLTKAMALDHASQNIRVNCICPGSVDTPLLRAEMEDLGGVDKMKPIFASRHPMNRIASPEEVARVVVFLASDESSFMTGAAIPVDGGRTAW
ncbi:MAG: SDR family NAD(P)-dependent oxidoreductase [Anaerolineales bacterium]